MIINCPSCNRKIKIKKNGHGRCKCGAHVKIIKWIIKIKKSKKIQIKVEFLKLICKNIKKVTFSVSKGGMNHEIFI